MSGNHGRHMTVTVGSNYLWNNGENNYLISAKEVSNMATSFGLFSNVMLGIIRNENWTKSKRGSAI